MQKHKKYLVITIWVSTIAFIGAGFVGWGSLDYGRMSKDVAVVGNIEISKKELGLKYQEIYSQYSAIIGQQKLDEKIEIQIEQMALGSLVSESLLLNLAKDWHLKVLDSEVANTIANMKPFMKDGKFDKATYLAMLGEKNIDPREFERSISKALLIQKIQTIIMLPATPLENEVFTAAYFSTDKINGEVINISDKGIVVDNEEAKAFWTKNKAKFKTTPKYDIEVLQIKPANSDVTEEEIKKEYETRKLQFVTPDGKQISIEEMKPILKQELVVQKDKKVALKVFVEFKNGKTNGIKIQNIDLQNKQYPQEFNAELANAKATGFIKPVWNGKEFISAKIIKVYPSTEMTFEQASEAVKKELVAKKAIEKLKIDAANTLKTFHGKPIGLISKAQDSNLSMLGQKSANEASAQILGSSKLDGFIVLNDKAFVYKVMEQNLRFKLDNKAESDALNTETSKYKAEIIASNLMSKLKEIYKVDLLINAKQDKK